MIFSEDSMGFTTIKMGGILVLLRNLGVSKIFKDKAAERPFLFLPGSVYVL